jgi:hypothetical protein
MAAHLMGIMLARCSHQPKLREAPSRVVASRPPLPDWSRKFHGPIPVQNRKPLVTLKDAATYIAALPKVDQEAAPWQLAVKMLLLVAEHGGDTMMPRIAMMKALHRHMPRHELTPRRKRVVR